MNLSQQIEKVAEERRLSPREKECLQLILQGNSRKMIAEKIGISYHTARWHVENLFAKLQAHSATQAVSKIFF